VGAACGINDKLRCWSEGMAGDKTFQQIAEEFAEIVIPRVWLREDRKAFRVAERLCPAAEPASVVPDAWYPAEAAARARRE
jgi:hypothetical protein